jgi:hypothetical protein
MAFSSATSYHFTPKNGNANYSIKSKENSFNKKSFSSPQNSVYAMQDENLQIILKKLEDRSVPKPRKQNSRKIMTELSIYVTSIIVFTGLIGNLLSLKVFFSTKVPRTSSRTYLIALTISDCIFLAAHFIDDTCKQIVDYFELEFPINITDQKLSMCRGFALVRSTCRAASPWIIVAFTLERFLVVNYPQETNFISKPLLAKRFVYFILIVSFLISLYAPILTGIVLVPTQFKKMSTVSKKISPSLSILMQNSPYYQKKFFRKTCDVLEDYRVMYLYFTFFYTLIIIIIPLSIVSIFNALLIMRLYKGDKWTSAKLKLHDQEMSYKEIRDKKVQIENLKITWTLVIISLTFILLTLPHLIFYFIISIKLVKSSSVYVIYKISELFYIFNHSSNFFLYVFTRKSFRRVLKQKLDCGCFNFMKKNNLNLDKSKKKVEFLTPNTNLSIKLKKVSSGLIKDPVCENLNEKSFDSKNNKSDLNFAAAAPLDDNNDIDYESYWEAAKSTPNNLVKSNEKSTIQMFKEERNNSKLAMLNKK